MPYMDPMGTEELDPKKVVKMECGSLENPRLRGK